MKGVQRRWEKNLNTKEAREREREREKEQKMECNIEHDKVRNKPKFISNHNTSKCTKHPN